MIDMIRVATKEDARQLLDIYAYYIEETAITFEYEVPSLKEFEERIKNTLQKYPYLVEEENKKILGYAYAGRLKNGLHMIGLWKRQFMYIKMPEEMELGKNYMKHWSGHFLCNISLIWMLVLQTQR